MLFDPNLLSFFFEINNLISSTKLFLRKLMDKFIPASKKILEYPNFFVNNKASFKSNLPLESRSTLNVLTLNFFKTLILETFVLL